MEKNVANKFNNTFLSTNVCLLSWMVRRGGNILYSRMAFSKHGIRTSGMCTDRLAHHVSDNMVITAVEGI